MYTRENAAFGGLSLVLGKSYCEKDKLEKLLFGPQNFGLTHGRTDTQTHRLTLIIIYMINIM